MQDSPEASGGEDEGVEAVDSPGIAAWDNVDALVEALLVPKGLAVTTEQGRGIRPRSMPSTTLTRDCCPSLLRHRLANGGVA